MDPGSDSSKWRVLPIRRVLFPNQIASFAIGKQHSVALVEEMLFQLGATANGRLSESARSSSAALLCVALVRDTAGEKSPSARSLHAVGTAARLLEVSKVEPREAGRVLAEDRPEPQAGEPSLRNENFATKTRSRLFKQDLKNCC